jgi:hypothetical protein
MLASPPSWLLGVIIFRLAPSAVFRAVSDCGGDQFNCFSSGSTTRYSAAQYVSCGSTEEICRHTSMCCSTTSTGSQWRCHSPALLCAASQALRWCSSGIGAVGLASTLGGFLGRSGAVRGTLYPQLQLEDDLFLKGG